MKFEEGGLYHVYNRGNNRHPLFFSRANYFYFFNKIEKYLVPYADILAWCLMPNHFHFLIHATAETGLVIEKSPLKTNQFSEGIRLLLSSYTKAIKNQEGYIGNLFQQRTQSKILLSADLDYAETVFHYIHQNPLKAQLVTRMEDWEFSSFKDYLNPGRDSICNRSLAMELFNLQEMDFEQMSQRGLLWERN